MINYVKVMRLCVYTRKSKKKISQLPIRCLKKVPWQQLLHRFPICLLNWLIRERESVKIVFTLTFNPFNRTRLRELLFYIYSLISKYVDKQNRIEIIHTKKYSVIGIM